MTPKLRTRDPNATVIEPLPRRLKLRHGINVHRHGARKDSRRSNDHITSRKLDSKPSIRRSHSESPRKSPKQTSNQDANTENVPTENSSKSREIEEKASGFIGVEGGCNSNTGFAAKVSSSPEKSSLQNATEGPCRTEWICKEEEKPYDGNCFEDDEGRSEAWSVLKKGPEMVEISKSDEEDMIRLSQSSVSEERDLEEAKSDVDLTPTKRKKKQKNRVVKRPRASKARRNLSSEICELLPPKAPAPEELQTVQQLTKDSEQVTLPSPEICDIEDKEVPKPELPKKMESARKRAVAMAEEGGAESQDHSSRDTPEKLSSSETPKNVVITVHCLDVPEHERSKNKGDQHEANERDVRASAYPSSQTFREGDASPGEKETLRIRDSTDQIEDSVLREQALLNTYDQRYANVHESDALQRDEEMDSVIKPKTPDALFSRSDMSMVIEDLPLQLSKKSRDRRWFESAGEGSPVHKPKLVAPVGGDGYRISKEGMDISRLLRERLLSCRMSNRDDLAGSSELGSRAEASEGHDRSRDTGIRPNTDECADSQHERTTTDSDRTRKDVNSLACEGMTAKREASKVLRENRRSSDCSESQLQDVNDRFPPSEMNHIKEDEGRSSIEMGEKASGSRTHRMKRLGRRKRKKGKVEEQNLTENKLPCKERKVTSGSKIMGPVLAKKHSKSSGSLQAFQGQKRPKGRPKDFSTSGRQMGDSKRNEFADVGGNARASHQVRRVPTRSQTACGTETKPEAKTKTPNLRHETNSSRRFTIEQTTVMAPSLSNEDEQGCLKLSEKRHRSSIETASHALGYRSRAANDGVKSTTEPSSKGSWLHHLDSASIEVVQSVQQSHVKHPSGEPELEQPEDDTSRDEEFGVPGSISGDMSYRNRIRMQKRKQPEIPEIFPHLLQRKPSQEQKKSPKETKSPKSHLASRSVLTDPCKNEFTKGSAIMPVPLGVLEKGLGQSAITQVEKEGNTFSVEVEELPKGDRTPNDDAEEIEIVTVGEKRSKQSQSSDPHAPKELENGRTFAESAPRVGSSRRLSRAKELAIQTKRHDLDYTNGANMSTEQNLEDLVDPEKLEEQSKLLTRRPNRSRRSRVGGAQRDKFVKALDELSDNEDAKAEALVPATSSSTQKEPKVKRAPKIQPQKVHHMRTRGRGCMSSGALHAPLAIIDLTDIGDVENTVADTRATEDDDDIAESLKELQRLSIEDKAKGIKERPHCKYLTPLSDEESQLAEDLTTRTKRDTIVVAIAEAGITLRGESFKRLRGTRWLDDEVLNAYVSLINSRNNAIFEEMGEEHRNGIPRTYVFNTYFFTRLCSGPSGFDYPGVKGWTKRAKVDILTRDIILIPINLGNHHWVLSAVDMEHKEVIYLDSMHGSDRVDAISKLKRWVFEELRHKHGEDIAVQLNPGSWKEVKHSYRVRRVGVLPAKLEPRDAKAGRIVKVPRQTDGGSCGVFTARMADCLSLGIKVYFKQRDIRLIRRRMALDLFHGYVPL